MASVTISSHHVPEIRFAIRGTFGTVFVPVFPLNLIFFFFC
jgi:hypothetical protein